MDNIARRFLSARLLRIVRRSRWRGRRGKARRQLPV